jgi:hypothetical protein
MTDHTAMARRLIDENVYMVLGTADARGCRGPDELVAPGRFRLYRATAIVHSVLIRGGDPEYGKGADSRLVVSL